MWQSQIWRGGSHSASDPKPRGACGRCGSVLARTPGCPRTGAGTGITLRRGGRWGTHPMARPVDSRVLSDSQTQVPEGGQAGTRGTGWGPRSSWRGFRSSGANAGGPGASALEAGGSERRAGHGEPLTPRAARASLQLAACPKRRPPGLGTSGGRCSDARPAGGGHARFRWARSGCKVEGRGPLAWPPTQWAFNGLETRRSEWGPASPAAASPGNELEMQNLGRPDPPPPERGLQGRGQGCVI